MYRKSAKHFSADLKNLKVKSTDELDDIQFKKQMKEFRKWADQFNLGVTHFGLDYQLVDFDAMVFDILHLKLATT